MRALVIVHLSTLDAYADRFGMDAANELAGRMKERILAHDGPVYVIDQKWPFVEPYSEPRYALVRSVELARDIEFVRWDERVPWEKFLKKFKNTLGRAGVSDIVLGGVWYDPTHGEVGCVTETAQYLKKFFPVRVDEGIVGCYPVERP